jgi:hypothetical protein
MKVGLVVSYCGMDFNCCCAASYFFFALLSNSFSCNLLFVRVAIFPVPVFVGSIGLEIAIRHCLMYQELPMHLYLLY